MNIRGFSVLLNGQSFTIDGGPYEERLDAFDGKTTVSENLVADTTNTDATVEKISKEEVPATEAAPSLFGGSILNAVILYAVVFGGAYFFWIKPQKKKEQKIREMQSDITTGNDVVTSSGFFGKVVDVNENAFVIEFGTNKGVRVPVRKNDVFLAKEPEKK